MKLRNKKTGEIVVCGEGIIEFKTFGCKNLAEFLESGWEDYTPAEPLIKDEKIRKAVRAWAEACKIESDDAIMISDLAPAFTRFYTSMYEIDIKTESSLGLDEHKDYTIAELCGEENEED